MIMSSPEPMALGSPSQSPPSGNNQYLPQFLLGDMPNHNVQMNSRNPAQGGPKYWGSSNTGNSPPRSSMLNPSLGSMGMPASSIGRSYSISAYDAKYSMMEKQEPSYAPHYAYSNANQNNSPHHERTFNGTLAGNAGNMLGGGGVDRAGPAQHIPGAPPVNRLVDMLNKPTFGSSSSNTLMPADTRNKFSSDPFSNQIEKNPQDMYYTPTQSRMNPPSPAQIDPFYNYGDTIKPDEKLDESWITIFGFPPSATSYVLQEFAVYGQILRHVPNTQGNWLHIQYSSKLQAQKALSKNGKVLANSLMVGVMPCIDKKVMDMYSQRGNADGATSPANLGSTGGGSYSPTSLSGSGAKLPKTMSTSRVPKIDRSQSLRTNVRPLGPYNRNGEPSAESLAANQAKLPKKNNNVISKAMEFMFGW